MLTQFFIAPHFETRGYAWGGLLAFLLHHLLAARVSAQLNDWFLRFYDLLGEHFEEASGESSSEDAWAKARDDVSQLLMQFMLIIVPMVVAHPISGYIRGRWLLLWRLTLIDDYIRRWKPECSIEGASQRIHEDTSKLASGVETGVSKILSAVMKLVVFLPILGRMDLGLVNVAAAVALGGLVVSVLVGHPLVKLEVNNQIVEAELRRRLVLLETHPTDNSHSFVLTINALRDNYKKLYLALAFFNYWSISFSQWTVILPYILVSNKIFAQNVADRITLGQLQQCTHAFGSVFDAFSVIGDSWAEVNSFRATVRRLWRFESLLATTTSQSCRTSRTDGEEIEMRLADAAAMITVVGD
jgi:peptide/bleomycin uptake transporter